MGCEKFFDHGYLINCANSIPNVPVNLCGDLRRTRVVLRAITLFVIKICVVFDEGYLIVLIKSTYNTKMQDLHYNRLN